MDTPVCRVISFVPVPSAASSTIRARWASPARTGGDRTHEMSTSRSRGGTSTFTAVVAGSAYGDQDGFRGELAEAGLPFVMALRPRRGTQAPAADAHTPAEAARELAWNGPDDPGDWQAVTRTFRDGHTETWQAADATLGCRDPDGTTRLVVATADPGTLPDKATWYLATRLPRPGGPHESGSPHPAADLAEIVRLYGQGRPRCRCWTPHPSAARPRRR